MKYNLLIWELVPEETQLFLIPAELGNGLLLTANGCMINATELSIEQDEAVSKVNLLVSKEYISDEPEYSTSKGEWVDFRVEAPILLTPDDSIVGVFICGFIL